MQSRLPGHGHGHGHGHEHGHEQRQEWEQERTPGSPQPNSFTVQRRGSGGSESGSNPYPHPDVGKDAPARAPNQGAGIGIGRGRGREDDLFARWLAQHQQDEHDPGSAHQWQLERLWRVMNTPRFAEMWYGAREAGESLRRWALTALYQQRSSPGGAHPDPREPAAFSQQAILTKAAQLAQARIWQVPDTPTASPSSQQPRSLVAWIITHPHGSGGAPEPAPRAVSVRETSREGAPEREGEGEPAAGRRSVDITVRASASLDEQTFLIACLMGYLCRDRHVLADPDAPAGIVTLPNDPAVVAILHQFAISLLALPRDCPEQRGCACNEIRARFNQPPPDHESPTDVLSSAELRRQLQRQLGATQLPDRTQSNAQTPTPPPQRIDSGPLT